MGLFVDMQYKTIELPQEIRQIKLLKILGSAKETRYY